MTHEAQPIPDRNEDVEASPTWESYSRMVDELEEAVNPLTVDILRKTPAEQSDRAERLIECKELAVELQEHVMHDSMPLLPERVADILKKIQETLNQKLH
ncbi:MAG: hypothetical protein Q7R93_04190 [bacterium]|nr:hypothetical protein [bacterium]